MDIWRKKQKMRFSVILLLIFLCFGTMLFTIPDVHASAGWMTVWEDDFADTSHIYADDYNKAGVSISGNYLYVRNTESGNRYQPKIKIRGLYALPVFNLTIEFTSAVTTSASVFLVSIREQVTDPNNAQNLNLVESTSMGAIFQIINYASQSDLLWVYKWYNAYQEFAFTNTSDNTLELRFDGINWKVAYTLDNVYLGEFDFYHRANRTGTINPFVPCGELELWYNYGSVGDGIKINKITQRVYVADTRVYGVAAKMMTFQYDDPSTPALSSDLINTWIAHNASITLNPRNDSSAATFSLVSSLIKDYGWESGLHTTFSLKSDVGLTTLNDTYYQVRDTLVSYGLTTEQARPRVFTALGGNHNWTHAQWGWENLRCAVRTSLMPYIRYTNNQSGQCFGSLGNYEAWYDWAVSETTGGGYIRTFTTFAHPGDFTYSWLDSWLTKIEALGYRTVPVWKGYLSLVNAYNSTFTVTSSSTSTLVFSVASGGNDVYVWANKPSGSGIWYVYDDLNQRVEVKENLSSKVGFWVEHGRTYTLRSTMLDGSIDSSSPYYADITASTLTDSQLKFTISAPSGNTTTTNIYCGSKGKPKEVSGLSSTGSWSYDDITKILIITTVHSSDAQITVSWASGSLGEYQLTVKVTVNFLPALGAKVEVNSENKTVNLLGETHWTVPYGPCTIKAYYQGNVQSTTIDINQDRSFGFNFFPEERGNTDPNTITITVIILLGATIIFILFTRRKR